MELVGTYMYVMYIKRIYMYVYTYTYVYTALFLLFDLCLCNLYSFVCAPHTLVRRMLSINMG